MFTGEDMYLIFYYYYYYFQVSLYMLQNHTNAPWSHHDVTDCGSRKSDLNIYMMSVWHNLHHLGWRSLQYIYFFVINPLLFPDCVWCSIFYSIV